MLRSRNSTWQRVLAARQTLDPCSWLRLGGPPICRQHPRHVSTSGAGFAGRPLCRCQRPNVQRQRHLVCSRQRECAAAGTGTQAGCAAVGGLLPAPAARCALLVQGSATAQPDVGKVFLSVAATKPSAAAAREEAALVSSRRCPRPASSRCLRALLPKQAGFGYMLQLTRSLRCATFQATEAVVAQVSALPGMSEDDITTLSVTLQPQYTWSDITQTSNITGYSFTQSLQVGCSAGTAQRQRPTCCQAARGTWNAAPRAHRTPWHWLQVKVANLTNDLLGSVIDTAVAAGGDNIRIDSIQVSYPRAHPSLVTCTASCNTSQARPPPSRITEQTMPARAAGRAESPAAAGEGQRGPQGGGRQRPECRERACRGGWTAVLLAAALGAGSGQSSFSPCSSRGSVAQHQAQRARPAYAGRRRVTGRHQVANGGRARHPRPHDHAICGRRQ